MALLHVRATNAHYYLLSSLKNVHDMQLLVFWLTARARKAQGRSLARAFATPIKNNYRFRRRRHAMDCDLYCICEQRTRICAVSSKLFLLPFFVVCLLLLFWGRGYSYFGEEGDWISILLKISKINANFDIIAACFSSPSLLLLPFASCS